MCFEEYPYYQAATEKPLPFIITAALHSCYLNRSDRLSHFKTDPVALWFLIVGHFVEPLRTISEAIQPSIIQEFAFDDRLIHGPLPLRHSFSLSDLSWAFVFAEYPLFDQTSPSLTINVKLPPNLARFTAYYDFWLHLPTLNLLIWCHSQFFCSSFPLPFTSTFANNGKTNNLIVFRCKTSSILSYEIFFLFQRLRHQQPAGDFWSSPSSRYNHRKIRRLTTSHYLEPTSAQ